MRLNKTISGNIYFKGRLSLLAAFLKGFLLLSLVLRLLFFTWEYKEAVWSPLDFIRTIGMGLMFDIGVCSFIVFPSLVYIFIVPNRFIGSMFDRIMVYFFFTLTIFILALTFLAEVTFWEEFHTRFNFIAVDYLIYTNEVIDNIRESYPLPLLLGGIIAATVGIVYFLIRQKTFKATFSSPISLRKRVVVLGAGLALMLFYSAYIENNDAEWSSNRYNNEIAKAGIYSFFAEFRNNRMDYADFYTTIDDSKAFAIARRNVHESNSDFESDKLSIVRSVDENGDKYSPNVVFILMESMSARFMDEFGNDKNITPVMDNLAQNSLLFSNLYATGTRTVRGMEAVTLCIPPTPGQSIVKRPSNQGLYTVGTVFANNGYANNFFYGGDGYFDNMNSYFGGNGFTIYDRGRGSVLSDAIKTTRHNINDEEVTFENAWGICDEDIYSKMLKVADASYARGEPFFNFVMTTSNHRPYTYPGGKIDIPSGKSRDGAVKYADYALGAMLEEARKKPWFKDTVFVIVADHCASSAGRDEIDVANYHIPAIIYNLPAGSNRKIEKQCSQIDIFPTLFGLLHWDYRSNFFGKDVLLPDYKERALLGTYRKLALMEKGDVVILSDQKKQNFYRYNSANNRLIPKKGTREFLASGISWYQTADYLYSHDYLKDTF